MKHFAVILSLLFPLTAKAQDLVVKGEVSPELMRVAGGEVFYLRNLQDGIALDSCRLDGNTYRFRVSEIPGALPLCVTVQNAYLVGEPGTVTVGADKSVSGTLLNEQWNAYLQNREKYQQEYRRRYQEAKNDVALNKAQREGLRKSLSDEYEATLNSRLLTLMRKNLENPVNALAFVEYAPQIENPTMYERFYALANEQTRECPEVKALSERIEKRRATSEGHIFTDFIVKSGYLDGTDACLSDWVGRGRYILVDFWASWCGPCWGELPYIRKAYEQYHGENFDILSVAIWDKRDDTLKALETQELPWKQIVDAQSIPSEVYGFNGIPEMILFGPDGQILARGLRGEEMLQTIRKYIQ